MTETEKKNQAMRYVLTHLLFSADKKKIARCNRCNAIVLDSDNMEYSAQCMECDEDLYSQEWHYEDIYGITAEEFGVLLVNTKWELNRYLG